MTSPTSGVRPPQQRRSRESLERVLRAGEALLADKGYEGFTIAEVSRRAKVSVGSVYGRFENKDALVYAIHRRLLDRLDRAADRADAGADLDLERAIAEAVGRLADAMHGERRLLRAFMLRGAVDPNIAGPGSQSSQRVAEAFRAIVIDRRAEIGHPDPELAIDVAFRMAYDVLARRVMYGPTFESAREIAWPDLVAELIRACLTYLRDDR